MSQGVKPEEVLSSLAQALWRINYGMGYDPIEWNADQAVTTFSKKFWNPWQANIIWKAPQNILHKPFAVVWPLLSAIGHSKTRQGQQHGQLRAVNLSRASPTPFWTSDQSTYHSELFGIWGLLALLEKITTQQHIMEGHVTVACNGLSVLKKPKPTTSLIQARLITIL